MQEFVVYRGVNLLSGSPALVKFVNSPLGAGLVLETGDAQRVIADPLERLPELDMTGLGLALFGAGVFGDVGSGFEALAYRDRLALVRWGLGGTGAGSESRRIDSRLWSRLGAIASYHGMSRARWLSKIVDAECAAILARVPGGSAADLIADSVESDPA